MKKENKEITPLNKFPTEFLLHEFRILTYCRTHTKLIKYEKWEPHYETVDSIKIPIYYTLVEREYFEKYNVRYSRLDCSWYDDDGCYYRRWGGQNLYFNFNGMYWEGTIEELRKELNTRPHIGIMNKKDYRKWKIKVAKNNKNKKLRK